MAHAYYFQRCAAVRYQNGDVHGPTSEDIDLSAPVSHCALIVRREVVTDHAFDFSAGSSFETLESTALTSLLTGRSRRDVDL